MRQLRVLGGTIPRMVLAEILEELLTDQNLIGVSPRNPWSGQMIEPVFFDRERGRDRRLVNGESAAPR
jgi:hypothetical protein